MHLLVCYLNHKMHCATIKIEIWCFADRASQYSLATDQFNAQMFVS